MPVKIEMNHTCDFDDLTVGALFTGTGDDFAEEVMTPLQYTVEVKTDETFDIFNAVVVEPAEVRGQLRRFHDGDHVVELVRKTVPSFRPRNPVE